MILKFVSARSDEFSALMVIAHDSFMPNVVTEQARLALTSLEKRVNQKDRSLNAIEASFGPDQLSGKNISLINDCQVETHYRRLSIDHLFINRFAEFFVVSGLPYIQERDDATDPYLELSSPDEQMENLKRFIADHGLDRARWFGRPLKPEIHHLTLAPAGMGGSHDERVKNTREWLETYYPEQAKHTKVVPVESLESIVRAKPRFLSLKKQLSPKQLDYIGQTFAAQHEPVRDWYAFFDYERRREILVRGAGVSNDNTETLSEMGDASAGELVDPTPLVPSSSAASLESYDKAPATQDHQPDTRSAPDVSSSPLNDEQTNTDDSSSTTADSAESPGARKTQEAQKTSKTGQNQTNTGQAKKRNNRRRNSKQRSGQTQGQSQGQKAGGSSSKTNGGNSSSGTTPKKNMSSGQSGGKKQSQKSSSKQTTQSSSGTKRGNGQQSKDGSTRKRSGGTSEQSTGGSGQKD